MKALHCVLLLQVTGQLLVEAVDVGFDSTPVNVTVIKGQPAMLKCTVVTKLEYQIIWMNPKRILISTEDRRVIDDTRLSIERPYVQHWDLHIRSVQVDDDGEYTCQINTDPIQIKRIRLKVQVPAEIDNKTSSASQLFVQEGETVDLQCVASGVPEPTVNWYRKTPQNGNAREAVGTSGERLIIHNITRHCGGMYECEASNNIAVPARHRMDVQVNFSPEVTFRTKRILQAQGKETVLECLVAANPKSVAVWTKDGETVSGTHHNRWQKFRTNIYDEDTFTLALYLTILNLNVSDFGEYTCEASNMLGEDSETMTLSEFKPRTPAPSTQPPRSDPHSPGGWDDRRILDYPYNGRPGGPGTRTYPDRGSPMSGAGFLGAGDSRPAKGVASLLQQKTNCLVQILIALVTFCIIHFDDPS